MPRLFAMASVWLFLAGSLFAKEVTIHGFVTDVKSPTVFEIDDYKVTRDRSLELDISTQEDDKSKTAFKPEDIRIGTELEVKGEYDESSGELKAKSIKVLFEDARKLRRTALLEQIPSLTKKGSGWEGEIRADGQRISVSPETSLTIKLNKSERENSSDKKNSDRENKNEEEDSKNVPLTSLDELNLDTFVRYEGMQQPDGSINAHKSNFVTANSHPVRQNSGAAWNRKSSNRTIRPSPPANSKCTGRNTTSFPTAKPRTISPSSGKASFPHTRRTSRPMIR
jgi:hypothetical protein